VNSPCDIHSIKIRMVWRQQK